ncbi:MAG: YbaB/EbfC family nucleoid-associated protein [Flavobacteriales bacterium]|nr:YbaB/EbfC family nucleoid-associated protein [Flavobacteriales bacterium]
MLGNFLNKQMLGKMGAMQQQMEEIKAKLENISVIGESDNSTCKAVASGNRLIKEITLSEDFIKNASKQEVESAIVQAANRALEQAARVEQSEMSHAAMSILPGLG